MSNILDVIENLEHEFNRYELKDLVKAVKAKKKKAWQDLSQHKQAEKDKQIAVKRQQQQAIWAKQKEEKKEKYGKD